MAGDLVTYKRDGNIATITMDDGKRNALSPRMFKELNEALDRAESESVIVILTGREDVFSAGFDLKVMRAGGPKTIGMLKSGYALTARLMAFPMPVIAACNGHLFAMGVFMLLSADYTIGSKGAYKISANEVAIGLPMPRVAELTLRHRLRPADFQRATVLAEEFTPAAARDAGFFDQLVAPADLLTKARKEAESFEKLDVRAHRITKRRVRKQTIKAIRRNLPLDLQEAVVEGLRFAVKAKK